MLRISACPPKSAGVERLFSSASLTHTKVRNRLSNERLHKLILIHRHFGSHLDQETRSRIEKKGMNLEDLIDEVEIMGEENR